LCGHAIPVELDVVYWYPAKLSEQVFPTVDLCLPAAHATHGLPVSG